jgi:hypothetical protein
LHNQVEDYNNYYINYNTQAIKMKFESNLLDKIISRGLLGRRQVGRPSKFNIVNKHGRGVLELMYQPRNQFEQVIGKIIHSSLPLLAYYTYRFQTERARAGGFRVEDTYDNKFFRENYIQWHLYAQNFHPHTMADRCRSVHFYRKTKTLFKGFRVPDWAQSHKREGWDVDSEYSREAWNQAMTDFNSEWTPMPFVGERLDPNIINWFRFEQVGKGFSSRLFYNEVPKPTWHRHGGHLDNPEKTLHSFKYGDQKHENVLGFDVSTEEGRQALDGEVQRWRTMTPEVAESLKVDKLEYSKKKYISNEPHFQRALSHYRQHVIQEHIQKAIDNGSLSEDDLSAARAYFDERGLPSASMIEMGQKGFIDDQSWESFQNVLEAINLKDFKRDPHTSMPVEQQLINVIDQKYDVTEKKLNAALPLLVSDERQREKIQSMIDQGEDATKALPQEHSRHLG